MAAELVGHGSELGDSGPQGPFTDFPAAPIVDAPDAGTAAPPNSGQLFGPPTQGAQSGAHSFFLPSIHAINLLRQEPRGFLALSADTLSDDASLRPINVRRLMILLRRLALRLGARYVFEPNDEAFRRLVKRGFDAMLSDMFVSGAFAGATPATSFQVNTSSTLNTPQSVDQGRFIVEIKVAPSLPMTFLTIRLVQAGDRTSVTEAL